MNNSDDMPSMPSAPTVVAGGAGRPDEPYDEPSLGSASTMVGQGVPGSSLGQIDQYQLVRKLGGGGFGVVYLARDTVSGIDVALKTLHPLLKSNPEEMEALRAKFALVSRLSHPNIASALVLHPCRDIAITDDVALRELRLSPGDFIMVMRYASGVTLSKWRRQFPDGVVPLDQALEVVRQVASALDYAHGERIVHRDIKPANVMVETLDGGGIRARILDFGLAAEIRSSMSRISTETGDTSGTRPYMAPEQWLGRKQDGRTDQYALACVLYELLSGAPPFAGVFETGDPAIMKDAVVRDAPEEIEGVPAQVNAALLKALAKNPKERFASCAEFVESCLGPQRTQSPQREPHTEAQRHGGAEQGVKPLGGATSPLPASPVRPDVPPHQAEPRKKSGKGWLVAALGAAAVMVGLRFASVSKGGASSPGEPQPVEARAPSSATQNDAAEYERRIAEEAVRREREAKAAAEKAEAERKAHEHGGVQLWAGGPYWAGTNIGAEKPEEYGLYFWWGDTVGYRRKGSAWVASDGSSWNFEFSRKNVPTLSKDEATLRRGGWTTAAGVLAPKHDAAHVHWGGGWRMPTKQELDDLGSKCDWAWTTLSGVKGYAVRGRGAYAGACIFLPAAGYGLGASLDYAGSYGNYWSSVVPYSDYNNSRLLHFGSDRHDTRICGRNSGLPVRPVLGFAK